jgi:hypothetical protein
MRAVLALAVAVVGGFTGLSMAIHEATLGSSTLRPAIQEFVVVEYLRMEQDYSPKAPPEPIHVLAGNPVKVFARTQGIVRLDVLVQISASDGFGVFSGYPDDDGFTTISVTVPESGEYEYVRIPGLEGRRAVWEIPPGMTYYLVPTGVVREGFPSSFVYGSDNEPVIIGEPIWVRLDE